LLKALSAMIFFFLCSWVLATPCLLAADLGPALETKSERESYSIGYQVGQSMKTDGVEVDFDKLVQGLQDAINDKGPLLSTQEMRALVVDMKKRARAAQLKRMQEQIAENAKESKEFMAENKKKEGVNTTKSGLQYRVLKEGAGNSPGPKDFVKVNYKGAFIDGKEFDSSKGEPTRVKADGVIKGWTEALAMMKPGAKWQLFVPPDLGYGRNGSGPNIPPNKVLVFDVELVTVESEDQAKQQ
jgi:FKBP-type peptidyl-prolyl cis-trans isomerase FklB